MKIAILSPFYPYRGGIAQFSDNLATTLESQQHAVLRYNFKRQYPSILFPGKSQYVADPHPVENADPRRLLDSINPISYLRTAHQLRRDAPDLLILRYWMSFFAPSLGYVARHVAPKTKVIAIMDNVIPHERHFFDPLFTRYFVGGIDGFVTMNEAVHHDLDSFVPQAHCLISPHPLYSHFGVRTDAAEARSALGMSVDKRTLLFFGLIRDYKGLDILLDAFELLDDRYQLLIAGEPYGSFEKYERQIERSSRRADIHCFTEFIPDDQVARYFSAADVCVLPYRSATQSGIASIAYHFEVPMITTDVGGLREAVADVGAGLVVGQAEPHAIANSIGVFFEQCHRTEFTESIRALKRELSWDRFARKLTDFSQTLTLRK